MRYYVTSDVHGYCSILKDALDRAGFFSDREERALVVLGDLFDRGEEENELQRFILRLMDENAVVLVRGNHEDLFYELVNEDQGVPYDHHIHNGTYKTALRLTGCDVRLALSRKEEFCAAARRTPYYALIMPAMLDFFETERFVFTHGWIPCAGDRKSGYVYRADWRGADGAEWKRARWVNGMDAALTCEEEKTILCGHWHCSYGHFRFERKGSELGEDADFSPYYGKGIVALDACTAVSGRVNVVVLEDEPLKTGTEGTPGGREAPG